MHGPLLTAYHCEDESDGGEKHREVMSTGSRRNEYFRIREGDFKRRANMNAFSGLKRPCKRRSFLANDNRLIKARLH